MRKLKIYTDGGCTGNPGIGGYGAVIIDEDESETKLSEGYFWTTNNRMEIMAVLKALEFVGDEADIDLYADSEYVLNVMSGVYNAAKNRDLWKIVFKLMKGKTIRYHWVRGHSGNKYNEMCDQLSNAAREGYLNPSDCYVGKSNNNVRTEEEVAKATQSKQNAYGILDEIELYKGVVKKEVNPKCKAKIDEINKKSETQLRFKDFADLKTYGRDGWSAEKCPEDFVSEEVKQTLFDELLNDDDVKKAIRWYLRGLKLSYAIKKIEVDKEITANAIKVGYGSRY